MRTNHVKRKLQQGEPSFGTWLSLGDLYSARTLARMRFDWLALDLEHSAIDWAQAAAIFSVISEAGGVPLARIPEARSDYIKRTLDAGAWGIVVPMIETVEQAQLVVAAAKYPPLGNRSMGGGMHFMNFDCTVNEYYRHANDEILVVLQTESPRGVENAEEIYSLPGVDAIFVGPVDLRAQMCQPDGSEPSDEEVESLIQRVITVGQRVGTPTGIHVREPAAALTRAEQGMQFIGVSSDLRMLVNSAQNYLQQLSPSMVAPGPRVIDNDVAPAASTPRRLRP